MCHLYLVFVLFFYFRARVTPGARIEGAVHKTILCLFITGIVSPICLVGYNVKKINDWRHVIVLFLMQYKIVVMFVHVTDLRSRQGSCPCMSSTHTWQNEKMLTMTLYNTKKQKKLSVKDIFLTCKFCVRFGLCGQTTVTVVVVNTLEKIPDAFNIFELTRYTTINQNSNELRK